MTDTTLNEAKRCPKCSEPGKSVDVKQDRKGKLYVFGCENSRCRWYQTTWTVEVRPDGSIPEPRQHVKQFHAIPDRTDQVRENIDKQIGAELKSGEVRR
jgi:hypothetical protein